MFVYQSIIVIQSQTQTDCPSVLKCLICVGQIGNCRYVRKENNISALLQIPFPEEKPVYKYQANEKLPNFDLSQHSYWFSSTGKKKNIAQNNVGDGGLFLLPYLMTAHDQANLQQTQRRKHVGAWRAFGRISSKTSVLSEKQPIACALLTVTKSHCHCVHSQHISWYKYLGISRKQY